jgi:hypothetical protein
LDDCRTTPNGNSQEFIGCNEWNPLIKHKFGIAFRKEEGNVESALVLIPLLILFLVGIELIVATNLRNGEVAIAQSGASERAISGQLIASDEVIELNSIDPFAHIRVLVSHRERLLPQLVPGLLSFLGADSLIEVRGAAVMETLN